MGMKRATVIAALLSVVLGLAAAGPASAFQIVKRTGKTADFGSQPSHADGSDSPGARCGYSAADSGGTAYLRWIKVYHFLAGARDITSGRDSQIVSFQAAVQRSTGGGAWKTVARSAIQKKTAYDDQAASFSDPKVAVHGTSANQQFRVMITLKWWRNGAVEGSAKIRLEYYSVRWTVGYPAYVYSNSCDGAAD